MGRLGYKVAVVTDGACGFGAEAAEALAVDGATVLMTGEGGEAYAADLCARGLKAEHHALDTGDAMGWAVLVDRIMRTHGHLDVLVNHAGANISTTIEDAGAAQLQEILAANLLGPFLGMKAVIAAMRQSGGGSIINIVANPIVEVLPLYALYSAAKAGLASLTKSTAVHCVQRGYDIRVNNLHLGSHETPLLTANAIRSTTARNIAPLLATLPKPAHAPLYDFGAAITFLAADESQALTGADLFCGGALSELSFPAESVSES